MAIRAQECHRMSNTSSAASDSPGAPGKRHQIKGRGEGGGEREVPRLSSMKGPSSTSSLLLLLLLLLSPDPGAGERLGGLEGHFLRMPLGEWDGGKGTEEVHPPGV